MLITINALTPILSLILVGLFLRKINFFDESVWPSLEKLSYFVLIPILLISVLSSKSLDNLPWADIALSVDIPVLVAAGLIWLSRPIFKSISAARFTSIFQAGVRFNTFVALAVVQGLYGDQALIIGAVCAGFMIILINFLCITTFSLTLHRNNNPFKTLVVQISKNPLIIGCLIGGTMNVTGIKLPEAASNSLEILGRASLPLALLCVGAALRIKSLSHFKALSATVGFIQFCIKPAVATLCCILFGLSGVTAATIILFSTTPTAPSGYILARQLGGDHQIMASMITQQTMFAFIAIPVVIWIMGHFPHLIG